MMQPFIHRKICILHLIRHSFKSLDETCLFTHTHFSCKSCKYQVCKERNWKEIIKPTFKYLLTFPYVFSNLLTKRCKIYYHKQCSLNFRLWFVAVHFISSWYTKSKQEAPVDLSQSFNSFTSHKVNNCHRSSHHYIYTEESYCPIIRDLLSIQQNRTGKCWEKSKSTFMCY